MNIKLPHLPFKFDSPEGRMEVTVRREPPVESNARHQPFSAGLSYLQPGPRALERIPLQVRSESYSGAMRALMEGFKINPGAHDENTAEFRVLTALVHTKGVVDLDS